MRGTKVIYSVEGTDIIKDSRFSFWKITFLCRIEGVTVRDTASNNICNQSYELRTSDTFSVLVNNLSSKIVSVPANAELLSEKDRTISVARSSVGTLVSPDFMGTIGIQTPATDQTLVLGTIEKIRFTAPFEISGKTISMSVTNGDVTYYLTGLNQTLYSNLMSNVVEFTWDVGKYSHSSATKDSGILPAGNYKFQITDGNWSSDYLPITIK